LRLQALRFNIRRIDAVLFTHDHADHAHGIDDLRCFNVVQKSAIPCFGPKDTMDSIRRRFSYIFEGAASQFIPQLSLNAVEEAFQFHDFLITPIQVEHGDDVIFGYRIGDFAYLTDCSGVPENSVAKLQNLQVLVIDGLRQKPHKKHFSVYQALDAIETLKPQLAYITHISHAIEHEEFSKSLPENVHLAYDGLAIECG
jgi:phosphoribosyl 1,2-cyclic phosphate phosphodiesterase